MCIKLNIEGFLYVLSDMKTSIDISRQYNCSPLWFNSTSSSIKKLKTNYNSALHHDNDNDNDN